MYNKPFSFLLDNNILNAGLGLSVFNHSVVVVYCVVLTPFTISLFQLVRFHYHKTRYVVISPSFVPSCLILST